MAHFAELDEDNIVKRVIVIDNSELLDASGEEIEELGIAYCEKNFGGKWVQTSYNAKFRNFYAGVRYSYDEEHDRFVPPQPYPSWTLDETFGSWVAPEPEPNPFAGSDEDGPFTYQWNENETKWEKKYSIPKNV